MRSGAGALDDFAEVLKGIGPRQRKAKEAISAFEGQLRAIERLREERFAQGERLCEAIELIHREKMHSEELAPLVDGLRRVCEFFSVAGGVGPETPMRAVRSAAERIGVGLAAGAGKEEALEKIRAARPLVFPEQKEKKKEKKEKKEKKKEKKEKKTGPAKRPAGKASCRARGAVARCDADGSSVRCLAKGEGASCDTETFA